MFEDKILKNKKIKKNKIILNRNYEGLVLKGVAKENCEKAEKAFQEQEKLLEHWQHIQEVFEKCRTDSAASPQKEEIARKLMKGLEDFIKDTPRTDDVSIIILKRA